MATLVSTSPEKGSTKTSPPPKLLTSIDRILVILERLFQAFCIVSILCMVVTMASKTAKPAGILIEALLYLQNAIQLCIWALLLRETRSACTSIASDNTEPMARLATASRNIAIILAVSAAAGMILTFGTSLLAQEPFQLVDLTVQLPGFPLAGEWRTGGGETSSALDHVFLINLSSILFPFLFWILSFPLQGAANLQKEQDYIL